MTDDEVRTIATKHRAAFSAATSPTAQLAVLEALFSDLIDAVLDDAELVLRDGGADDDVIAAMLDNYHRRLLASRREFLADARHVMVAG
jgi:hypothetical protein